MVQFLCSYDVYYDYHIYADLLILGEVLMHYVLTRILSSPLLLTCPDHPKELSVNACKSCLTQTLQV